MCDCIDRVKMVFVIGTRKSPVYGSDDDSERCLPSAQTSMPSGEGVLAGALQYAGFCYSYVW